MRRSAEFTATLRASSTARAGGVLVLHARVAPMTGGDGPSTGTGVTPRVGFVVPRAVGPAVVRNIVRRRLRHLLRDRLGVLPAGSCLVVRVLPGAAGLSSPRLADALDRALERVLPRLAAGGPR